MFKPDADYTELLMRAKDYCTMAIEEIMSHSLTEETADMAESLKVAICNIEAAMDVE